VYRRVGTGKIGKKQLQWTKNRTPTAESFAASVSCAKTRGLPVRREVNLPFCAIWNMEIQTRRHLVLFQGTRIGPHGLVETLASILIREDDDFISLITPVGKESAQGS